MPMAAGHPHVPLAWCIGKQEPNRKQLDKSQTANSLSDVQAGLAHHWHARAANSALQQHWRTCATRQGSHLPVMELPEKSMRRSLGSFSREAEGNAHCMAWPGMDSSNR